jgi:acyl-CoA oxidase
MASPADLLGSEEQKRELLPDMAQFRLIGAWGLTEPSNGSDASALQTTAKKARPDTL